MRTALVTGANRGIGYAIAGRLAEHGHHVIVGARDHSAALASARSIACGTSAVRIDVADGASVLAAAAEVGPVDVLVNNAAVLLDDGRPITECDPDRLVDQVAVNAAGALRVTQAFLPGMVDRGWGRVVMLSSENGRLDGLQPRAPGYSTSKAALNAVTVLLAEAVRGSGVLINAVSPGRVGTRMLPSGDRTPEQAATGIVAAAMLPDDGPTGAFIRDGDVIAW